MQRKHDRCIVSCKPKDSIFYNAAMCD